MSKDFNHYYLENILAHVPEYIFWKDLNSLYLGCNQNFALLAGLENISEIVGKSDLDLPWSQYAKGVYLEEDKLIIETKKPITHESVPIIDSNGRNKIIMISKAPMFNEYNQIIGILGVFHDITELKNTQNALLEQIKETKKAYLSKTQFLSTTTHEIRNPVGNITTYNNFLKNDIEELNALIYDEFIQDIEAQSKKKVFEKYKEIYKKMIENIDIIERESHKAIDYLKNLGELHRLQNKKLKTHIVPVRINDLIEGVIKNAEKFNIKNIKILCEIDQKIPAVIEIDYINIYEALQVILSNAVRFSCSDSIVKFDSCLKNEKLEIIIEDFGQGISIKQINDLLFEEKNKKYIPLYKKPSLKLTQARIKILASGGDLSIERKNIGTKVIVSVPYKISKKNRLNSKSFKEDCVLKKRKILVVEDDELFQKSEKIILEKLGQSVCLASTGQTALEMFHKNQYDIIFLDITLPDMSGVEIIKKMRKTDRDLVIIVVTSHAYRKDIEYFEEIGATLVLTKPVSHEKFRECLEIDFDKDEE